MNQRQIKISQQNGAALLITIIVLLGLTIIALSTSNTSRIQSIMARNAQFDLKAWNESFGEISLRLNALNARSVSEGIPDYISALEIGADAECIDDGCETPPADPVQTIAKLALENIQCLSLTGGDSAGVTGTNNLKMEVISEIFDTEGIQSTGIFSDQRQRFDVNFTYGQLGNCTPEEETGDSAPIPGS